MTNMDFNYGYREEMVENLGCIARSGSKAFMEQFKAGGQQDPKVDSNCI